MGHYKVPDPVCAGCNTRAADIVDYQELGRDAGMSAAEYVLHEEGTLNTKTGKFLCDPCYIKLGMPTAPGGWVVPDDK